jgi:hypothetical protein
MAENPDPSNLLPTRGELVWKSMFASSEAERDAAKQLLAFGLCRKDDEHPTITDRRMDPSGHGIEASPMGALIKSICDSQPPEPQFGDPGADEPTTGPTTPPPAPLLPIPPDEDLGESMKKLQGIAKPPPEPLKSKYFVAPPPSKPSTDLQPLSWDEGFDSNQPIL